MTANRTILERLERPQKPAAGEHRAGSRGAVTFATPARVLSLRVVGVIGALIALRLLRAALATSELTLGPHAMTLRWHALGRTREDVVPRESAEVVECETLKGDAFPRSNVTVRRRMAAGGLELVTSFPNGSAWWLADLVAQWARVRVTRTTKVVAN